MIIQLDVVAKKQVRKIRKYSDFTCSVMMLAWSIMLFVYKSKLNKIANKHFMVKLSV